MEKENEGKCYEVQYCVILNQGPDKGLKHYVWVSKEQVKNAMKILDDNKSYLSLDSSDPYIETKVDRRPNVHACFNKERMGSLVFLVPSKYMGNWAAEMSNLPSPFP